MRNAFIGYSYQKQVTHLILAMMDVERKFDQLEIEADINNHFDDLQILAGSDEYYCQMKDLASISLAQLSFKNNQIIIAGKPHTLSKKINVLFFKHIDIEPNDQVFGLASYKLKNVHLVSLNQSVAEEHINNLYRDNFRRVSEIRQFFSHQLDSRELIIRRNDLPPINVFKTELVEPSINIGKKHLKINQLLLIEGKPGVGKSHFVNCLKEEYPKNIVYRFWVSSQDKDYTDRLKYSNFIFDLTKKLFKDQAPRNESEVIDKINADERVVIIDGLDHVENYNVDELEKYIDFIDTLKTKCKTIVLTRPLRKSLTWTKQIIDNWNKTQTEKVLNELFHITDYNVSRQIFSITNGYPILVKYVAEHFKIHNEVPNIDKLTSVDDYYEKLIQEQTGKHSLSLFLCSRSFFMKSEIESILDGEPALFVHEFINEHPYLFEIRLNRISLYHDSFNTFLRKQEIDYSRTRKKVNEVAFGSIIKLEKRFLSRFASFDLEPEAKKEIIKKYSSIDVFTTLLSDTIDFDAIQSFYQQLRHALTEVNPDDLELIEYYDLSLISNMVLRDHVSTTNSFLYTYVKYLLRYGYSEEDITSSGFLFGMVCYVNTEDATVLFNLTSDRHFDTSHFDRDLTIEKEVEDTFFQKHSTPLSKAEITVHLSSETWNGMQESLTFVLEDLYINSQNRNDFAQLYDCINSYVHGNEKRAVHFLESFLEKNDHRGLFASSILKNAKRNILALGKVTAINDYLNLTLSEFIEKNRELDSFDTWVEILNFIRLSAHREKKIDLGSLWRFWTKYHSRKDYSLYSLSEALKTFGDKGYITTRDSVELISTVQEKSEKGYRGLLLTYIEQLRPEQIIPFLEDNFHIGDLHISWFLLSPNYINTFSDKTYDHAVSRILNHDRHSKKIDYDDISNPLKSIRKNSLIEILNLVKYKVRIEKSHGSLEALRRTDLDIVEYEKDNYSDYKSDSESHYNDGILTNTDTNFILAKKLTVLEVAGYSDGNYSALSDLDIFQNFEKEDVRKNIKGIIYNSMLGKVKSINSFYNLYHFPGNLPKLLSDYEIEVDFTKFYESFKKFLGLSMIEIPQSNKSFEV
jgi:hypothetical protein